jgi:hypothetical protein
MCYHGENKPRDGLKVRNLDIGKSLGIGISSLTYWEKKL